MGVDRPWGISSLFTITSECVCVTKPCGVYLEKAMKVKNINTVNNPMEKTCAAEKNRTTDSMWVEKKAKKCGSTRNRKEPYDVLKRT